MASDDDVIIIVRRATRRVVELAAAAWVWMTRPFRSAMSPDAWQVMGIAATVILALLGVLYGWLRWEQKRLAKNIHDLRTYVSTLSLWLERIKERLGL